jgi:HNH endonuclease
MNLAERLYLETDDSCALCGLRTPGALTIHHIDGDSQHDVYENTILLCHNCHKRYHDGKGISDEHVIDRKRHLIHKTVTTFGVNAMKIAARNNFGVVAMPFLLYHLVDLGYMTKEEDQMGYGAQNDATSRFAITALGRNVLVKMA